MHDKDELEHLESLYRKVLPVEKICPDKEEDEKILDFAKSNLEADGQYARVVSIERYKKARAVWSGVSIAAGLLLGILINPLSESGHRVPSAFDGQIIYMSDGPERQHIDLDTLDATELQTLIAELVLKGEVEKAEALLLYFRSKYPDFSNDK